MFIKYCVSILFAFIVSSVNANEIYIGKTVEFVVTASKLKLTNGVSIAEPPSVSRGLYFESQGKSIQIFIARGQLPLTHDQNYTLSLYKPLTVIGYRVKESNAVKCFGEVLWHFGC